MRALRSQMAGARLWTAVAVLAAMLPWAAPAAAQENRFTIIDSSPTSWVARGYTDYTVTPADGWTFTSSRNFDNGVQIYLQGPPLPGTSVDYWRLNFAAPGDALLVPGSYPNIQRFPFQDIDRPGLEFGSTGRLDNQAGGFFDVLEATYGPGGEVLTFAADFTHYGEAIQSRYTIAEIRYNAVPEPAAVGLAVPALLLLRRKRG